MDRTPLHWAIHRDNSHAVVGLLGAGADPNAKDEGGNTPLYVACKYMYNGPVEERMKVLKALLEHGADIHAANDQGELPVHSALREQESAAVKCLLQQHYSTLFDREGRLPLHAILEDAQSECVLFAICKIDAMQSVSAALCFSAAARVVKGIRQSSTTLSRRA
jgi:cytohesin